ncbi:hypothetical protein AA0119_g11473 [Alternaria tenuissima]|uniref:Uncharacterized protein n=1 Tax=Alternaria tenuissima TaxID=119927 RepID=A0A4Q4P1E4_9PLEO|nr:hypothetical protein AA0115_g12014 [Alternaria tenuissima]RYN35592.1 hypothetical protein AA0114_g11739 [Alternaria tenuissima]RYN89293.1 hypothetical protein AA0119_g11473 [Alternaria tenuissima]
MLCMARGSASVLFASNPNVQLTSGSTCQDHSQKWSVTNPAKKPSTIFWAGPRNIRFKNGIPIREAVQPGCWNSLKY